MEGVERQAAKTLMLQEKPENGLLIRRYAAPDLAGFVDLAFRQPPTFKVRIGNLDFAITAMSGDFAIKLRRVILIGHASLAPQPVAQLWRAAR